MKITELKLKDGYSYSRKVAPGNQYQPEEVGDYQGIEVTYTIDDEKDIEEARKDFHKKRTDLVSRVEETVEARIAHRFELWGSVDPRDLKKEKKARETPQYTEAQADINRSDYQSS